MKLDLLKRLSGIKTLEDQYTPTQFVDSGSIALNYTISGKPDGGWPVGYISEIAGESSTGKTVFITHAFAGAQKNGWYTVLEDNEFTYNLLFAKSMGVDPSQLIYNDPLTVPEAFQHLEDTVLKIRAEDPETPIVAAIDSMAGQSDKESEKQIGEFDNMDGAVRAKEVGQCLRHINPLLKKHKVCLLLINQIRLKPGVLYGNPEVRAGGGKALEYYCGTSFKVISNKSTDIIKEGDKPLGIKGTLRNTKNKVYIPFRECEFKLVFDKGLDRTYGILPYLVQEGLLDKKGGWYEIKSTKEKFQESEFYNGSVKIPELTLV